MSAKVTRRTMLLGAAMPLLAFAPCAGGKQEPSARDWRETLRQAQARFTGQKGTLAQFGDSITVTQAYWSPLRDERKNAPPEMERAFRVVQEYLRPESWRDWKGPEYGSEGGKTAAWAEANVDTWLKKLNPEVALIMFGTNDLAQVGVEEYRKSLRNVARKCLENGTFVILSTIPPRHGFAEKAAQFAQAVRELGRELGVPVIDFHAEVLKRRPDDWDGQAARFNAYKDYDVPTLLARDGVHPSYPQRFQNDYSEEALRSSGYSLRSYLSLIKYAEVVEAMKQTSNAAMTSIRPPEQPWFPKATPLPKPTGPVIRAASVEELLSAAERVTKGGTIVVADGFYRFTRHLEIKTDGVTLRGESGRRERVLLDGGGTLGELLKVTACSGVTIADLTVQNVMWNGIKINSETNVQKLTIHNCILHNIWERAVKGVKVPEGAPRPADFRIRYCLFYNDRAKRYEDDPNDRAENFGGNYIGGIDTMFSRRWTISDNVFVGIKGRTGSARGAVFIWHESEECVVERNIIIDCDSGICLGNSSKPDDVRLHCRRFTVRNNFVTRAHENGILADYTENCRVVHNTVHDPQSRLGRLIRLVHDNEGLVVANNLLSGPDVRNESQSRIDFRNNVAGDFTRYFTDAAAGNLRLKERLERAVDRAFPLRDVREDIDGKPRGSRPDVGAFEYR